MTMAPSEALKLLREAVETEDEVAGSLVLTAQERVQLLGLIDEAEIEVIMHSPESPASCNVRFIVLEGLDGVGKTTTTKALSAKLGTALNLNTPPPSLAPFRSSFDTQPSSLLRRAYYTLGNILVSKQIRNVPTDRTVVLDRFWPSTYAYQVAKDLSSKTKHGDYNEVVLDAVKWPWYLVKPTSLVLLVLDEKARLERIGQRGVAHTEEEIALDKEIAFRKLVLRVYQGIPGMNEVDSSNSTDQIVDHILSLS